jgi:hypothetical protein
MSNEINFKEILGNKTYVKKLVEETFDAIVKDKKLSVFSEKFSTNVNKEAKETQESKEARDTAAKAVEAVEAAKAAAEAKAAEAEAEAKAVEAKTAIFSGLEKGNTIIFNSFVDSIQDYIINLPSIKTNIGLLNQIKVLIANDIEINKELEELKTLTDDADKNIINGIGKVLTEHQNLILTEQKKPILTEQKKPKNLNKLLDLIKKKMEQLNKIMKKKNNIQTGGSNMKQQLLTDLHYITKYLKYKTKYIVFKSNN